MVLVRIWTTPTIGAKTANIARIGTTSGAVPRGVANARVTRITIITVFETITMPGVMRIPCSARFTSMAGFGSVRVNLFGADASQPRPATARPRMAMMMPVSGLCPVIVEVTAYAVPDTASIVPYHQAPNIHAQRWAWPSA